MYGYLPFSAFDTANNERTKVLVTTSSSLLTSSVLASQCGVGRYRDFIWRRRCPGRATRDAK